MRSRKQPGSGPLVFFIEEVTSVTKERRCCRSSFGCRCCCFIFLVIVLGIILLLAANYPGSFRAEGGLLKRSSISNSNSNNSNSNSNSNNSTIAPAPTPAPVTPQLNDTNPPTPNKSSLKGSSSTPPAATTTTIPPKPDVAATTISKVHTFHLEPGKQVTMTHHHPAKTNP
eukprot:CAMPEP_0119003112 /NCGR_PEP_ID=MMETSP1176-20130426/361_1 /TAXON_ID=265551 /ORGANISM="Synedropsis recta cf, Strain CCMP1620" /LENGTH=170 /DNA_ID=CAMNT_0006954679 /DNA_START=151 /DNA_END=663 /DNA_ORIENTATION=+